MVKESRTEKRKRKKGKRRKKWLWILTPFLLLLTIVLIYGVHLATKIADVTNEAHVQLERGETSEMRVEPVYPGKDNFSVLFIGVDEREGETKSRSDVLILATFNKDDHSIKMLSIPRDSRVEIPGYYTTKINTAHFLGGVDLAVETVEAFLDVPVDYYVKLNFDAFIEIVDAIGGVTVDVPFTFTEMDSEDNADAITLYEGTQHLDGEEALAFVRMRKQDPLGDFGRNERQKQVIKAIIEESATFSSITKYDDIIDSIGENMTTNFTFQNIIALHPYASSIDSIESLKFEGQDTYIDGTYYFTINEDSRLEMSNLLKEHLGIEDTAAVE
ncbi:LCP family protein [Fervidibacillus albus]|uniref:LCP family protein n=1 Tax=Fervidibacillus albus TaxID=2980026 RepID=A0A9E8LUA7_9BACI|nr:LCP family protein [Fervidibacillus albus]WAA09773.1 LCP family protein [Fervidibacillus albus]